MKKCLIIILISLCSLTATASSVIPTSATVTGATVYSSGVKLQLYGQVDVKSGYNKIVVFDIPRGIQNANAIRTNVTKGTIVLSVQYRERNENDAKSVKCTSIEKQIKEIDQSIAQAKIKLDVLGKQVQVLELYAKESTETVASADYLAQASDFMGSKLSTYLTSTYDIQQKIIAYELEKQGLSKSLHDLSSLSGVIEIDVDSPTDRKTDFTIELISSQAYWKPIYDIRIEKSTASIITKAQLSQNTGLDWNNIKLNFTSSNIAQNSATLPVLSPLVVGQQLQNANYQMSAYGAAKSSRPSMSAAVHEQEMFVYNNHQVDMAVVNENANIVSFQTTVPYSVANQSVNMAVKLGETQTPIDYQYLVVSIATDKAFLTANIKQASQLNLFDASANIYLDGEYVGVQNIDNFAIAYNDNMVTISLGQDKDISFIKTVENFDKADRVITKNNTHSFLKKVVVTNNKAQPVNIKLLEQYPISASSNAVVEKVEFTASGKANANSGIVTWVFDLAPKQTSSISMAYQVKTKQ